jgi:predicted ATPase/DNA-binding CsgD family transcriptional regulator
VHESSKHNLPSEPTPFIGRQEELIELGVVLTDTNCRLLTLCGPGGVGKTRLAIEVATRHITHFSDGVWITELEPVTTVNGIIQAIINALGLQLQDGRDLRQQLLDNLSERRLLLILDNFEHLLDGVDLVNEMLEASSRLSILVTSRETLKLREEWIRHIRGLDVPDDEKIPNLETYSAVQLFVENVRRVRGDFSLAKESANIVQLCQMVEGLPLALELVASWLKVMPCSMIIKEMEHSLDLLESPLGNMPPRHQSMRSVFEQSWRMLSEEEQDVFKKLGTFRGGFSREAAKFVCGATLFILSNLVDKALIQVNADGRYHLHSLLRQYAEEKLRDSVQDYTTACDQHCRYYAEFLHEREKDVWRTESLEIRREIGVELDNIRRAFEWALERQFTAHISKVISAFTEVCYQRSLWREGYALYGRIVDLARDVEDYGLLWRVLASQGWFALCLSEYEQAARDYDEALTIGRQCGWQGNAKFKSFLMLRLSEMSMRLGNLANARIYAQELVEDHSDGKAPIWTLETLGRIEYLAGDYQKARHFLQEALKLSHTSNNMAGIAVVSNHLGYVYVDQRNYPAAQHAFEESLSYGLKFDYQRAIMRSLVGLGTVAFYVGRDDVALSYFLQVLDKAWQIRHDLEILNAITGVASLSAATGNEAFALELVTFAHQHPGADWEARTKSKQLLDKLESTASSEIIANARDRASILHMKTIIDRILAEYPQLQNENKPVGNLSLDSLLQWNQSLPEPLTERELEVLELIANGKSNRQIAEQLFIGVNTVKKHVTHILGKLGVSNRIQAVNRLRE